MSAGSNRLRMFLRWGCLLSRDVSDVPYDCEPLSNGCPYRKYPGLRWNRRPDSGQFRPKRLLRFLLHSCPATAVLDYDLRHWLSLLLCVGDSSVPDSTVAAFPRGHVRWYGAVSRVPCDPWIADVRRRTDDATDRSQVASSPGFLVHPGGWDLCRAGP